MSKSNKPNLIDELKEQVIEMVSSSMAKVSALEGWSLGSAIAVWELIESVVVSVESIARHVKQLDGSQKKKLASSLLNDAIDIPAIPEWIEGRIFDFAIEGVVALYNYRFGKLWGEKFDRLSAA